jgi:hypothetical protein
MEDLEKQWELKLKEEYDRVKKENVKMVSKNRRAPQLTNLNENV